MPLTPEDFGDSFKNFMNTMSSSSTQKGFFQEKLLEHFKTEPLQLAIVTQRFEIHEQPNLHVALEAYLKENNRSSQLFGVVTSEFLNSGIGDMLRDPSKHGAPTEGPIAYDTVPIDDENTMQCVKNGLYLIFEDETRLAAYTRTNASRIGKGGDAILDVMAPNRMVADKFVHDINLLMRKNNIYRGKVLSIEGNVLGDMSLKFQSLRRVERNSIILPEGLLERIERSTVNFGRNAEKLRKWKRHLRRGLLLYGPPGTGKTLTAMYLSNAMPDRTMLIFTSRATTILGRVCTLARALQPSMVVIEDVDLIGEDRTAQSMTSGHGRPFLMDLMNEMDGLSDDADTIFLLTTNRAEVLEPALASRPGRVDQAFELPLPDANCRRQLFNLYSKGLPLGFSDFSAFVDRTAGASPAFIKELMRLAANFAADEDCDELTCNHIDEALRELVVRGGKLNQSILGFQPEVQ